MSTTYNCGCDHDCDCNCEQPINCIEQAVNDALAGRIDELDGYADRAETGAENAEASATDAANSATQAGSYRDQSQVILNSAQALVPEINETSANLQETAEIVQQLVLNASSYQIVKYPYTVLGGESSITVPETYAALTVQSIIVEGVTLQAQTGDFTFDSTTRVITLTQAFDSDAAGTVITIQLGQSNAESPETVLTALNTNSGAGLVGWKRTALSASISTIASMLNAQPIYCYEFADQITVKGDITDPTTWDWTPAINAAIAASKASRFQPVVLPHHKFISTGGHSLTTSIVEYSGGTTADGKKYKGVPIVGYGADISQCMFKPATSTTVCFDLVGNGGGHRSTAYLRDFTIQAATVDYRFMGYGIQYNCVNYVATDNVATYFLNEGFRLHNGIAGGWTEFNSFTNCFAYRCAALYTFVRTLGNDSFNGTQFTNCFGQIRTTNGTDSTIIGGYGIKATGVSSTALVWLYNAKLDIQFYAGNVACKTISLTFAEFTNNAGDIRSEGAQTLEAIDDYSRMQHNGNWINNGTTTYSVVTELAGAQGRFVFRNAQSKSIAFTDTNFSSFTPYTLRTTPDSYSVNGAYPALFRGQGTNFASPFLACYDYAGNGLFIGRIAANKSLSDFTPSWWLSSDGGILQSYNTTMRFRVAGGTETFYISATAIYPQTNSGMTNGLATSRFSAGYYTGWNVTSAEIIPTSTATSNIGRTTLTVNNLYMQNAVTVVSDINYKANKVVLSEDEEYTKLIAAVGTVKFSAWQMKAAIAQKGEANARWHVGIIAQELKEAITAAGLQWDKYGLLAYSAHSQIVTKGDDGNYYPVLDGTENAQSDVPVNSYGYIDMIDGADSVTTSDTGVITYTREIYMVRTDEFVMLRMAYIESKMS